MLALGTVPHVSPRSSLPVTRAWSILMLPPWATVTTSLLQGPVVEVVEEGPATQVHVVQ